MRLESFLGARILVPKPVYTGHSNALDVSLVRHTGLGL